MQIQKFSFTGGDSFPLTTDSTCCVEVAYISVTRLDSHQKMNVLGKDILLLKYHRKSTSGRRHSGTSVEVSHSEASIRYLG